MICTDLVARGVDFKAVNLVINYDLPTSGVTYVHRVGRTGRAGRKGKSITFFTEDDFDMVRSLSSQIYIESTIFHFQGMRECDILDLILDSVTDAALCAFTADYTLKRLEDHQKQTLVKKKEENKRFHITKSSEAFG